MQGLTNNPPSPTLFDGDAKRTAESFKVGDNTDSYTQLRRFYDELCTHHNKLPINNLEQAEVEFKNVVAFFKMMKSRAAYAWGRGHISDNCKQWLDGCVTAVNGAIALNNFKLHFEAVMGFVREIEKTQKDSKKQNRY